MVSNYYIENKLVCSKNNEAFIRYLADLKSLFEKVKVLEESGELGKSKYTIMDSYGTFTPNVYDVSKEARQVYVGEYADKTIEVILRYDEIFERLSEEDINFLTGYNFEVTRNRIKLFLMQQLRDIESLLS